MSNWNRRLWGIELTTARTNDKPTLLGCGWSEGAHATPYFGEPSRALLFTTRAAAREWCRSKMISYADRADCCADWRFRPVRVVEKLLKI